MSKQEKILNDMIENLMVHVNPNNICQQKCVVLQEIKSIYKSEGLKDYMTTDFITDSEDDFYDTIEEIVWQINYRAILGFDLGYINIVKMMFQFGNVLEQEYCHKMENAIREIIFPDKYTTDILYKYLNK